MNTTLVNQEFIGSVSVLRRILPRLSFGLLVGTYLISAIIMGLFHAKSSTGIGFYLAAFLVPLAIQAGRGTLVFFFQLNPSRVQNKLSFGIIAATLLLTLSLIEACLVMWPHGLAWTFAVATLMIIGWIIEIMILKEIQFAGELELYSNSEKLEELKQFYLAKREFEEFKKSLDGKSSVLTNPTEVDGEKKKGSVNSEVKSSVKILELIAANKDVTIREMAEHLSVSIRAVEKQIAKLKADKKIKRVGARRGGHWEIIIL